MTFFITVHAARDLRSLSFSTFPFSGLSFLFPLCDEISMKIFNTSDNVSDCTANFVGSMKCNFTNYHYQGYVKEGEYKARRINDNHKRNAIG